MNISIVREDGQRPWTLFSETEETARAIIRSHVRVYDDTDDALLDMYLSAALDYMQELSDRILGSSIVTIRLNKDEIKRPVIIPKVQNVTFVHSLKYRTKDVDGEFPYGDSYSFYLDEIPENEVAQGVTLVSGERYYELDHNNHTHHIDYFINGSPDDFTPVGYTQTLYKYDTVTNEYDVFIQGTSTPYVSDVSLRDLLDNENSLTKGFYKLTDVLVDATTATVTSTFYFVVTDGTDLFDCDFIYRRYPMYLEIGKLAELPSDASEYNEDYVQIVLDAGTPLPELPFQYAQAALMLTAHYYNQREAEAIGVMTTEVKEGVRRLMQSVRQY